MRELNALLAEQVAILQVQIECLQALIGAMSKELEVVDIGVRVKLAVAAAAAVRGSLDADDHSNARGRHLRFIANMLNVP